MNDIMRRLAEIGKDYPIDTVMENVDITNCYEGWTEELRYFFYRYDEHLAAKAGEKISELQWNKIWAQEPAKSIEHIKAQNSGVSYMHHLGNLMMLPPGVNSKLQDDDPIDKVKSYQTSGLLSAIKVASVVKRKKWDRAAVETHAKELIAWARTEWKD